VSSGSADERPELARERVAEVLRSAWPATEEAALEDETRRLMLHLAIQPYEEVPRPAERTPAERLPVARPRRSLFSWVFGRATRSRGA
jgi:hypothetical protein